MKNCFTKDPATGLPVYSLYGETRRPTDEMLKELTHLFSMFRTPESGFTPTPRRWVLHGGSRETKHRFLRARPAEPARGEIIEGPMLDADKTNFVAYFPLPVRYGLTIGELAQFFNAENHIGADLHVITMRTGTGIISSKAPASSGFRLAESSDHQGSVLYPGIEILQSAGVSVGRGTQTPFEEFGAPWMNGDEVAAALNARNIPACILLASSSFRSPGCTADTVRRRFHPDYRSLQSAFDADGLEIAAILQKLYPKQFEVSKLIELVGNADTVQQLQSGVRQKKSLRAGRTASRRSTRFAASIFSTNSFGRHEHVLSIRQLVIVALSGSLERY